MKHFDDFYDCVVIGASIAGLTCAIKLAKENKKVLVLEQHNLPGGLATSFVRGGVEFEATLHALSDVGSESDPRNVREFFDDEINSHIEWLPTIEAYRAKSEDVDLTVKCGFIESAKEIDRIIPGSYDKTMEFYTLCETVNNSSRVLTNKKIGLFNLFKEMKANKAFFKTVGYTVDDVFKHLKIEGKLKEVLGAYWVYLGVPTDNLPFNVFIAVISDYIGNVPYIARHTSFEIGSRLHNAATKLGVTIEYGQKVDKILVKKRKVYAVKTKYGEVINTSYVACGAYPSTAYNSMVEPISEVTKLASRFANHNKVKTSNFTVCLLLDCDYKDLNISTYSTFMSLKSLDSRECFDNYSSMGPYNYMTVVCPNVVHQDASPLGTCIIDITTLPNPEAWNKVVSVDNYFDLKRTIAKDLINAVNKVFNINLFDHIKEVIIQSPISIVHYTDSYNGAIYGYTHNMNDHVVARFMQKRLRNHIKGLYFVGAHGPSGDGMGPAFTNGKSAYKDIISAMNKNK